MKRWFLFCIALVLAITLAPIKAKSTELDLNKIRVGLFYNNLALNSYQLHSNIGFKVGLRTDQEDFMIMNFSDKLLNIYVTNFTGFELKKENIKNERDAFGYAARLSRDNIQSYLFFDGAWSVWGKTSNEHKSMASPDVIVIEGISNTPGILLPCETGKTIFFTSTDPIGIISVDNKRYRGTLEIGWFEKEKIQVVNELSLEEYLYGVIPKEVPPSWHKEVLKAQAVAARTYAVANLAKNQVFGFDVSASSSDQIYGGYDVEDPRTNEAVDETKGEVMLYKGQPIVAFYHSDSGGRTEACKDVFGSNLFYLQSIQDMFDTNSPHSRWELSLSMADINNLAKSLVRYTGEIHEISIIEKSPTGRVKRLLLKGDRGEKIIEGSQIRDILQLKSNFFDIFEGTSVPVVSISGEAIKQHMQLKNKAIITGTGLANLSNEDIFIKSIKTLKAIRSPILDNTYIITGRGYGHGVGMSQWGAKAMAEKGCDYMDILQHYYKDVTVKMIYNTAW